MKALPTATEAKAQIAEKMTPVIEGYIAEVEQSLRRGSATLFLKTAQLKERHLAEREALKEAQAKRWVEETKVRAARFRGGVGGLWDRITGRHRAIRRQNEEEAYAAIARDDRERDALADKQLEERRAIQHEVTAMRQRHHEEQEKLRADVAHYAGLSGKAPESGPLEAPGRDPSSGRTSRPRQPEAARDSGLEPAP